MPTCKCRRSLLLLDWHVVAAFRSPQQQHNAVLAASLAGSSGQVRRGCALLVLERLIHVVTEPLFLRPITASLLAGTAAGGDPHHHAPFRETATRQASPSQCSLTTAFLCHAMSSSLTAAHQPLDLSTLTDYL